MTDVIHRPLRVAIVGVGNVGATFAYALLTTGAVAEIVLIDLNRAKAEGEAMDLNHAVPFIHPTRVWAGDYSDCAGAAVTVLSAGASQKPGETRLDFDKEERGDLAGDRSANCQAQPPRNSPNRD
jgi:L-lactate dehydrogenase